MTHNWIFKIQKSILLCTSGVKIRIRKTSKVWAPFLSLGWVMYVSHTLTSNTISAPACTPSISLCCRLFIILQIQLLSFFLPQENCPVLLSLISFLLLQQLQTSSDSPSNSVCQACLQLDSHLALLWLVYFDLIKMHPSRTLGSSDSPPCRTLHFCSFSHCFLYKPGTTSFFNYNKQCKNFPSKTPLVWILP